MTKKQDTPPYEQNLIFFNWSWGVFWPFWSPWRTELMSWSQLCLLVTLWLITSACFYQFQMSVMQICTEHACSSFFLVSVPAWHGTRQIRLVDSPAAFSSLPTVCDVLSGAVHYFCRHFIITRHVCCLLTQHPHTFCAWFTISISGCPFIKFSPTVLFWRCWMLWFCDCRGQRGISWKVSWLPLLKIVVFLPNTAQCDTRSIPSQNNCSLRDEPPHNHHPPTPLPQVFFTQALHYQSHRLKTTINTYNWRLMSKSRCVTSGSQDRPHVKWSVLQSFSCRGQCLYPCVCESLSSLNVQGSVKKGVK